MLAIKNNHSKKYKKYSVLLVLAAILKIPFLDNVFFERVFWKFFFWKSNFEAGILKMNFLSEKFRQIFKLGANWDGCHFLNNYNY